GRNRSPRRPARARPPPRPWPAPGGRPARRGLHRVAGFRPLPGAGCRRAGAGARAVRGGRPRSRPGPGASGQDRAGPFDGGQLLVDAPAGVVDRVAGREPLLQRRVVAALLPPTALAQHFLTSLALGAVV